MKNRLAARAPLARAPPIVKEQGWPDPYIYTVSDRIFGDYPAKNTVYTLYIWFWPTL